MLSVVFFFEHKTADEMRISDWSSDVCSSYLREARDVDDVVEHPHRDRYKVPQRRQIEPRLRREGIDDQPRQVDRTEVAGAIRRQRLLSARISGLNFLAIMEIVPAVDAVDEDDAGFGIGVGRLHDAEIGRASGRERVCQYV